MTSLYYGQPYPRNFIRQGTRDSIPYCVVKDCIEFHEWIGGQVGVDGDIYRGTGGVDCDISGTGGCRR